MTELSYDEDEPTPTQLEPPARKASRSRTAIKRALIGMLGVAILCEASLQLPPMREARRRRAEAVLREKIPGASIRTASADITGVARFDGVEIPADGHAAIVLDGLEVTPRFWTLLTERRVVPARVLIGRGIQVALADHPATEGTAVIARAAREQNIREARPSPGASQPISSVPRTSRSDVFDRRHPLPFVRWTNASGGSGERRLQHRALPAEPERSDSAASEGSRTRECGNAMGPLFRLRARPGSPAATCVSIPRSARPRADARGQSRWQ